MFEVFSLAAGRTLGFDENVFESERETGHRNRAIGHLLRAAGAFEAPVDEVLDLYFRQCSVSVTAVDLAARAIPCAESSAASSSPTPSGCTPSAPPIRVRASCAA